MRCVLGEVRVETEIDASPAELWAVLSDMAGWAAWNDVIVEGRCDGGLGARVSCRVAVGPIWFPVSSRTTIWEEDRGLGWGEDRGRALRVTHGFLIEPSGDGSRFIHFESFEGAIGRVIYPLIRRGLTKNYAVFNESLKRRLEG